ncbi:hypothetical protein VDG1235_1000 [Verrucomicrobiia bacterium DG1235]|nr:hypothetical protein VDG1235_1000 [Verrucomicrobiae bacterium DG1235]
MKLKTALIASIAFGAGLHAADIRIGSNITEDTVWTNDNTYILDSQVFVIDDATLTIEPGTVVKGAALSGSASTLVITRGSKLYAAGSPSDPIIFTAEADPMDGSWGPERTNQWGGLIILGDAPLNSVNSGTLGDFTADPQVATVDNIEGLINSPDNDWTEYGGLDPEDNSGIIRYVSIRHGGAIISSGETNNEINGLTMGGVGRGTVIEFVEVFANKDDGFEWFGGTVDARYLVAAFGNDDSFDYDLGWRGRGQFWFSLGTTGVVTDEEQDHAGEHDGFKDTLVAGSDRGLGSIYNATYIGAGPTQGEGVFEVSDDAGVRYYNSIFMDFGHGVDVKNDAMDGLTTDDGDGVNRVDFTNNIWFNLGATGDVVGGGDNAAAVTTFLTTGGKSNTVEDPMLGGLSRTDDGGLDPRPMAASPAFSNALATVPNDGWYIDADYQGAFGETNWLYGWTYLSERGYLGELNAPAGASVNSVSSVTTAPEGGFSNVNLIVHGEVPRLFIIRARGLKLIDDGLDAGAVMQDPQLQIRNFRTGETVVTETGWLDRAELIDTLGATVGMSTLAATTERPTDDTTAAAVVVSLNPGIYVVRVSDEQGGGGAVQIAAWMLDR